VWGSAWAWAWIGMGMGMGVGVGVGHSTDVDTCANVIDGWMDEWMNGWMDGQWKDGRKDGRMEGRIAWTEGGGDSGGGKAAATEGLGRCSVHHAVQRDRKNTHPRAPALPAMHLYMTFSRSASTLECVLGGSQNHRLCSAPGNV